MRHASPICLVTVSSLAASTACIDTSRSFDNDTIGYEITVPTSFSPGMLDPLIAMSELGGGTVIS